MKIEQIMTRGVRTCCPEDSLAKAAQIMWDRDCGCVPVVRVEDDGDRVVGMVTDRDVCMAAYTQGMPLDSIPVSSAMAARVYSCRSEDSTDVAMGILRAHQLHRLPVVDTHDHLVGIVSLADLAREAHHEHARSRKSVTDEQIGATLAAVSEPRGMGDLVSAA
ncbi:MAG: CBS domain-containing protein [Deltaproteobacteria bacterium]|nr:CBS domain-containing protein [Deltaproteobacteria bacterium]